MAVEKRRRRRHDRALRGELVTIIIVVAPAVTVVGVGVAVVILVCAHDTATVGDVVVMVGGCRRVGAIRKPTLVIAAIIICCGVTTTATISTCIIAMRDTCCVCADVR